MLFRHLKLRTVTDDQHRLFCDLLNLQKIRKMAGVFWVELTLCTLLMFIKAIYAVGGKLH
jgi:hypothetical protein